LPALQAGLSLASFLNLKNYSSMKPLETQAGSLRSPIVLYSYKTANYLTQSK